MVYETKLQLKISEVAYVWLTQLDNHYCTSKPVIEGVGGSIPSRGNFLLKLFKTPQT